MFFSTQIKTFGLDISDKSIKVAQVEKRGKFLILKSLNKINLPDDILTNGEIQNEKKLIQNIRKVIDTCRPLINNNYVVASLPEVKTFIKLINIPFNTSKKILNDDIKIAVRDKIPENFPLSAEDINFDCQLVKKNHKTIKVLVGVAPKQTIQDFSSLLKKCGLIPTALEIEAQSIIRSVFSKHNLGTTLIHQTYQKALSKFNKKEKNKQTKESDKKIYFIIDFGASRSSLIVRTDKTINFSTSLKTCGCQLTQSIAKSFDIDLKKAEKLKNIYGLNRAGGKLKLKKILTKHVKELAEDILKAKKFYETNFTSKTAYPNYKIILTGGSSNLKNLDQELSHYLNISVSLADPLSNVKLGEDIKNQNEQTYSTAIGLALREYFYKYK
jgi:type IV pilus assembly protein PilM